MENIEKRPLPKKTIISMLILTVLGVISLLLIENGKAQKATSILHQLGYKHVSEVVVFTKTEVVNQDTNVKGYQYALRFNDLDGHKICQGFISKDFKHNVLKDLKCKDANE